MNFENYVALEEYYRETTESANARYRRRRKKERRKQYTNRVIAISVGIAVAFSTIACGVREMPKEPQPIPTAEAAAITPEKPPVTPVEPSQSCDTEEYEEDYENEKIEAALLARAVSIGECKITHYCCERYEHICGTGDGLTATGTYVTPYVTVAVDPRVIPLGSDVYINGEWYVAADVGGAIKGNRVDIAVTTHQEALELGVIYAEVFFIPPEA